MIFGLLELNAKGDRRDSLLSIVRATMKSATSQLFSLQVFNDNGGFLQGGFILWRELRRPASVHQ
jgi:hypothetical protein